jgi:hypothetical protein
MLGSEVEAVSRGRCCGVRLVHHVSQVQEQAALALTQLLTLEEDERQSVTGEVADGIQQQQTLMNTLIEFGCIGLLLDMVTSGASVLMQAAGERL